jgi:hypothetical protein
MHITHVYITAMPRPMPEAMFDPMPEVIATFAAGSTKRLFSFYTDELSFQTPPPSYRTCDNARAPASDIQSRHRCFVASCWLTHVFF